MEPAGLKVLMISTDSNILIEGSAVSVRMKEYGELVGELHIVLMTLSTPQTGPKELSSHVLVYPTNSSSKMQYPFDAARIGKQVVFDKKFVRGQSLITTQDPFECGWAGLKIKNKWRIPLEVQLHTDPFSPYFRGMLNSIRKHIARDVLAHADAVRVVSQSVAEEIKKSFPKLSPTVLPIYIDRSRIENHQVTFDLHARFGWHFILLAVARLTPEKNLSFALEVLQRVLKTFPDTGLVIVGDGSEKKSLEKKVRALKVERSVAFVGWQENLAPYYKTANTFIQTSYFEGYGLALVEAGLSGLPIVSTPVGVANDFKNGQELYVCPHNNVKYMSDAIMDLIQNNHKRNEMRIFMKHALERMLLSKHEYLQKLTDAWVHAAAKIQ